LLRVKDEKRDRRGLGTLKEAVANPRVEFNLFVLEAVFAVARAILDSLKSDYGIKVKKDNEIRYSALRR